MDILTREVMRGPRVMGTLARKVRKGLGHGYTSQEGQERPSVMDILANDVRRDPVCHRYPH